jgi:hypothetical protein
MMGVDMLLQRFVFGRISLVERRPDYCSNAVLVLDRRSQCSSIDSFCESTNNYLEILFWLWQFGDVGRGVPERKDLPAVGQDDRIFELAGPFRSANGASLLYRIRFAYRPVAAGDYPGRSGYSARKACRRPHSRRGGRHPKASPGGFRTPSQCPRKGRKS